MNAKVKQILSGMVLREGAGVKLRRFIGPEHGNTFDPFLLLDYFDSADPLDYIAGFPPHPHRGFETITYLLAGQIEHQDNNGHKGIIRAGDVQWMTAGRGIVHSEMPKAEGRLWGLQLWLNLPAKNKMIPPRYQEFTDQELPRISFENGTQIKIIAGAIGDIVSPLSEIVTQPLFLDISLPKDQSYMLEVPLSHQCILLSLEGAVRIGTEKIVDGQNLVQFDEKTTQINLHGVEEQNRFILICARRIKETIARLGPFVMNSSSELSQAIEDFKNNRF
ncbi:pirin-like protein [Legionella adelaidensis]|uniref:Pirin-like protein n=1 Tax=Legionella adelaidensis TaxID=45056 RepID=A0A0W0R135_9GAMM|nr:pirin family protein [Legionella adelaidensis]KTC64790.1 pirin-like protein [Legionella adelaidensis]